MAHSGLLSTCCHATAEPGSRTATIPLRVRYAGVALRRIARIRSKWNIAEVAKTRGAGRNSVSVLPSPGGSRREERREEPHQMCFAVDVTLLSVVFSFQLPNKSGTYLCLLLIYDFI